MGSRKPSSSVGDPTRGRLSCWQVRRTLQSFLDGEVQPLRAELVAAHLESCARCHVEGEILAQVIAAIQRLRPDLDLAAYTRLVESVDELGES